MSQISLAGDGYTAAQVLAALQAQGGSREDRFTYQLLSAYNEHKAWLVGVEKADVGNNALAEVKRTAGFTIREGYDTIDYLSDRIKPWTHVRMATGAAAPVGPGSPGWRSFPMGVFLLATPTRTSDERSSISREVEAYDQGRVLADDRVTDRYLVAAGQNYITGANGVAALLVSAGISAAWQHLTPTTTVLPVAREWEPGTSKLKIVNDLLEAINYLGLYFDADGYAVAEPYVSPATRAPEFSYEAGSAGTISPVMSRDLDLFDIANKWTLLVSQADRAALVSTYTNTSAGSPTSTSRRGRTITDFRTDTEAADQTALDAKVARLAFEASQVYEAVEFESLLMPQHGNADVISLTYGALGLADKFSEHEWVAELRAGALMKHRVRRVVTV